MKIDSAPLVPSSNPIPSHFTSSTILMIALSAIALVTASLATIAAFLTHPGPLNALSMVSPTMTLTLFGLGSVGLILSIHSLFQKKSHEKQSPNTIHLAEVNEEIPTTSTLVTDPEPIEDEECFEWDEEFAGEALPVLPIQYHVEVNEEISITPSIITDPEPIEDEECFEWDEEFKEEIPLASPIHYHGIEDATSLFDPALCQLLLPKTFLSFSKDDEAFTVWHDGGLVHVQKNLKLEEGYCEAAWLAKILSPEDQEKLILDYIYSILSPSLEKNFYFYAVHQAEEKNFPYLLLREEQGCRLYIFKEKIDAIACLQTFKQLGYKDGKEKWLSEEIQKIPRHVRGTRLSGITMIEDLAKERISNETYFFQKVNLLNKHIGYVIVSTTGNNFQIQQFLPNEKESAESATKSLEFRGYKNGFMPLKFSTKIENPEIPEKENLRNIKKFVRETESFFNDRKFVYFECPANPRPNHPLILLIFKREKNTPVEWLAFNNPIGSRYWIKKHFKKYSELNFNCS